METDYNTLLLRGRGAALLRAAEATPEALLHACTHFTGYDFQVDGSRAEYLFDVIVAARLRDTLEPAILEALPHREGRDRDQLLDLALLFALDGSSDATGALRDTFFRCLNDPERPGAKEWLRAAGLEALPLLASEVGHTLPAERAEYPESSILRLAEREFGAEAAIDCLRHAAATDPSITRFVDSILVLREEVSRQNGAGSSFHPIAPTFDAFVTAANDPGRIRGESGAISRAYCWHWGRNAPERELVVAAKALGAAPPGLRLSILRAFRERPFPMGPSQLFAVLTDAHGENADAAWEALRQFKGPEIHERAEEALRRSGFHREALRLLARELEEPDLQLLRDLFGSLSEEDDFHDFGLAMLDACEEGAGALVGELLVASYDRGNCGVCRLQLVQQMRRLGVASPEILDECRHDASLDLRAAANAWSRPAQSKIR